MSAATATTVVVINFSREDLRCSRAGRYFKYSTAIFGMVIHFSWSFSRVILPSLQWESLGLMKRAKDHQLHTLNECGADGST